MIPEGCAGRLSLGAVILIHLIVYNEEGGTTAVFSALVASGCAIFSATCKSSLKTIQIPYLRATQKFDFFCMFLASWMDILSLLAACGALARTLSTCMDAMSGGMARIYLLGRNSPENEPWPDVLGVSVVFLLTVMFMLGLENNKVFSVLMTGSVIGMTAILSTLSGVRGTIDEWKMHNLLPQGNFGLLCGASLITFSYPSEIPSTGSYKRCIGYIVIILVGVSTAMTALCLSTLTQWSPQEKPFVAVPILSVLERQDFHKVEPAVACLLVLACSGAFLELFQEMFQSLVKLTTSEWRILARQIGYENSDSGSPVLAIFTGGSMCAMLAFACPLKNLIYILAASHLCSGIIRALFLLYSPYRPKYIVSNTNDTSLAYSRLDISNKPSTSSRSLWCCIKKSKSISILPTSKSMLKKTKRNEELEREWLLLGEPQSPRVVVHEPDAESSILSEPAMSDVDCIAKESDSESSTDIDAIVDEYRQKVKVSTAGPMEKIVRIPSIGSWRIALILQMIIFVGIILAMFGAAQNLSFLISSGTIVILISLCMLFLPKYIVSPTAPSTPTCAITILFECILLVTTLSSSWPAILFWIFAGLTLYIRCDTWCCLCLEQPHRSQLLLPNVTSNMTSIRIPVPPRGSLISSRINGHR